jgi:hypothetical protein
LIARPSPAFKPAPLHPVATYSFLDREHFRHPNRFTPAHVVALRALCPKGKVNPARLPPDYRRFDWRRIHGTRPTTAALDYLEALGGVVPIYRERSLDLIFASSRECWDAERFINRHSLKKYRRRPHRYERSGRARYTDKRKAPNNLVIYSQPYSRVTGELYCLHLDWRTRGRRALAANGGDTILDHRTFDPRHFWRQRLLLREIDDYATLGRWWMRWARRVNRRRDGAEWTGEYSNAEIGKRLFALCHDVQGLVDRLRPMIPQIHKVLIPLDCTHLLPQNDTHSAIVYPACSPNPPQRTDPTRHFFSESLRSLSESSTAIRHGRKPPQPRGSPSRSHLSARAANAGNGRSAVAQMASSSSQNDLKRLEIVSLGLIERTDAQIFAHRAACRQRQHACDRG